MIALTIKALGLLKSKTFFGLTLIQPCFASAIMNMVLHGIEHPNIEYMDTLSKRYKEENKYDVILANPPLKAVSTRRRSRSSSRAVKSTKTELLFILQMERMLVNGGRCAVIIPDGVLFGSSNAHVAVRKKIVEECQLEGVISMPSGVFNLMPEFQLLF